MVTSTYTLGCMYGRNKHKGTTEREDEKKENELKGDHPTGKRWRKRIQSSKKKGCPATLTVKEVVRFPQFKVDTHSKFACVERSKDLRKAIQNGEHLEAERRFYISFPSDEAHNNIHQTGTLTGFLNPINKDVKEKIHELVGHGVQNVQEMKRHLKIYVETVLFPDPQTRPATTHAGFYPHEQTLRNHMYVAVMALRYEPIL
ncbi:calcium-responsive transcription factor-like [Anneissia japonica]|uniref:calcium-responsive transcription factor-like n=1 Tax=Anneissia japonica TaxID=1529436 RepID=UPI0014255F69|nr:calcium-responsive transcription factor-like [Anneissia japonica]